MDLRSYIRDIPDFPKEGIVFFDITPLLGDGEAFAAAIDSLYEKFKDTGATKVLAAEARGFIFGAPLAYKMGIGFVPVRKPGKLPYNTVSVTYDLEYGSDTLCMHEDAVAEGEKVLVIDDLLATGGTAAGMLKLVQNVGGEIAGLGFLVQLGFLDGKDKLENQGYSCLLTL
ncbi:adenine phosphoribosyltransferase [Oceanidesulfovibrio marinus]|uniref:Adenine phosphoribosyltransferase n=1 Tax=Oceanidesulfovibrio marinus TaxID=370038 RepID=A0A6P1ZHR8_9BACT|nr:adenine phosphoribosyltransferase [Oceanidesulfovibrio marinus]QJT08053.1 adenine phosphoribosyltransferase [Oceanidesulfovibrio marinus]TVM34872.1 adenine phosphoribosyltransferase [Oceanidesulfovibrio marinus]